MDRPNGFYVPVGLDVSALLRDEEHRPNSIRAQLDKYHYVLDLLYQRLKQWHDSSNHYVHLCYKVLMPLLGAGKVKEILTNLIKWGIIESDSMCQEGIKCYGYRLTRRYRDAPHRLRSITNGDFALKLQYEKQAQHEHYRQEGGQLFEDLCLLRIDYLTALKYLLALRKTANGTYTQAQYDSDVQTLRRLHIGDFFFHQDEYKRVHQNLTNLSKRLRPFIYHRDFPQLPLVNIDISNSQPLFLAALLQEAYAHKSRFPSDVRLFIELTQSGQLYKHLMKGNGIAADQRKKFKQEFFTYILFGSNSIPSLMKKRFAKEFPMVSLFIRKAKRFDHAHLAHRMQRLEARLMIMKVGRKLHNLGVWFVTIHDSIVCLECDASTVSSSIMAAFRSLELTPHLTIQKL